MHKNYCHPSFITIALEAETAIMMLPTYKQEHVTHQVAHNLQRLYKQYNKKRTVIDITNKKENKTINHMKKKLTEEKAMITKADKDKSIIILCVDDYNRKIDTFISNNSFMQSTNGITIKLRVIRTAINEWRDIIPKDEKWKYINLNPEAPSIRGLVKIHKEDSPIGPIISWKNVPAYKLAKVLVEKHQTYIALLYTFNVKNTTHLIHDLFDIPCDQNLKFASFDITNMYTNIPTSELVTIIDTHGVSQK